MAAGAWGSLHELLAGFPVEGRWSTEAGRHLVAARPILPGEVVLRALPYATILMAGAPEGGAPAPRARWCVGCLRFRRKRELPLRCGSCGASYCSERCQDRAARMGLRTPAACRAQSMLATLDCGLSSEGRASAGLLVSIAARAAAQPHRDGLEPDASHVLSLATLPERLAPQALEEEGRVAREAALLDAASREDAESLGVAAAAAAVLRASGWASPSGIAPSGGAAPLTLDAPGELERRLLELHARICCNSFGLSVGAEDGGGEPTLEGWGLWPAASLFNHDCMPTLYIEHGRKAGDCGQLVFRALRAVAAGSHLTISYGRAGGRQTGQARATIMREVWRFECSCEYCRGVAAPEDSAAFFERFRCNGCHSIGPSRGAARGGEVRAKRGCSCLPACNRLAS